MLHTAIGHAEGLSLEDAAARALDEAAARVQGFRPRAALLFSSFAGADHAPVLARIRETFGGLELAGCTTDGEISANLGFGRRSVALALLGAERLEFAAVLAEGLAADPEGSLSRAADLARARLSRPPCLCLAFPDGLSTIGIALDQVLGRVLGPDLPVVGGTAGDCFELKRTWQFGADRAVSDGAALLFLAGDLRQTARVGCGWTPVGRGHRITESSGNVVRRIGERTARDFIRHYLGEIGGAMCHFPLAVSEPGSEDFFLRDPVYVDETDGSVRFVGNLPENAEVRFAEAGRDDILDAAGRVSDATLAEFPGRPDLCLIVSCASRRHLLGTRAPEEFASLARTAPGMPYLGFYSYGEIGPRPGCGAHFYNDSFVFLALGE